MAKLFIFDEIDNMILGSQGEALIDLKWRKRFLFLEELDSLKPNSFSFTGLIVA
jgi:hypothetical protein